MEVPKAIKNESKTFPNTVTPSETLLVQKRVITIYENMINNEIQAYAKKFPEKLIFLNFCNPKKDIVNNANQ